MGIKGNEEPDRQTVRAAVESAWPHEASTILHEMKWDGLAGCWLVERYGMTIGIERDGYVHS